MLDDATDWPPLAADLRSNPPTRRGSCVTTGIAKCDKMSRERTLTLRDN
jgi:hypothetical protein